MIHLINDGWLLLKRFPLITLEAELFVLLLLLLRRWDFPQFRKRADGPAWRDAALVGVVALAAHLLVLPLVGIQEPGVHDEFSYLLMADTFVSGRLTNPVHPLPVFFESFHVNQGPTYSSTYPPGQGVVLAIGQLLGHPAVGVWLSTALLCAALCWMLQAWTSARWALAGGLLAVLRLGLFSYWANSYWGGSVAAIGGCLVWGAAGRLRSGPRTGPSLLLALGLIVLAASRPYEGLWCSIPAVGYVAYRLATGHFPVRSILRQAAVPLAAGLLAGAAALGYYNFRVFGSPWELPYWGNRARYSVAGSFLWEGIRQAPAYNHAIMREFYTRFETSGFVSHRTLSEYVRLSGTKLTTIWIFYLGPALTLPLLVGLARLRRRDLGLTWPVLGAAAVLMGLALLVWPTSPHYFAPATACLYLLVIDGLRGLYAWRRETAIAALLACVAILPFRASAGLFHVSEVREILPMPWYSSKLLPFPERERVMERLRARGGRHLVVVRYKPSHSVHHEFVYNRADIDGSEIVWARELPGSENRLLVEYFRDRSIWLLRPDESEDLVPYSLDQETGR